MVSGMVHVLVLVATGQARACISTAPYLPKFVACAAPLAVASGWRGPTAWTMPVWVQVQSSDSINGACYCSNKLWRMACSAAMHTVMCNSSLAPCWVLVSNGMNYRMWLHHTSCGWHQLAACSHSQHAGQTQPDGKPSSARASEVALSLSLNAHQSDRQIDGLKVTRLSSVTTCAC